MDFNSKDRVPLPEFVRKYIGDKKALFKQRKKNYQKPDLSNLNQTERTIEELTQMKTPNQIESAYREFIDQVNNSPTFIQHELRQFFFPLFLHLAKTLSSQNMRSALIDFIKEFKTTQQLHVQNTIENLYSNINSLEIPEYDIKITRFTHSYLLSILDSEKLSIISIIILKDIKYTIIEPVMDKKDQDIPIIIKKKLIRNEFDQIVEVEKKIENEETENHFISDILQLTLYNHHNRISVMKIANTGRLFAYSQYSTASLFILNDSKINYQFPNKKSSIDILKHSGRITSLCFSDNSCMIASGATDNDIRIAHTEGCAEIAHYSFHTLPILDVSFMPNSYNVLGASMDKSLSLWSMNCPHALRIFNGHTGAVTCTSFPRQNMIASGSLDGTIRIWDVSDAKIFNKFDINETPVCIFMHNDLSQIICGTKEGSVITFDPSGNEIWRAETNSFITDVKITHDGKHAFFSCENGVIETWTMEGKRIAHIQNKETSIQTFTLFENDIVFCAGLSKRGQ